MSTQSFLAKPQLPLIAKSHSELGVEWGYWEQVLLWILIYRMGLPAPAALLRSTEPPKQSPPFSPSGFNSADSTHLERHPNKLCDPSPPLLPSSTPTMTKALCLICLHSLPSTCICCSPICPMLEGTGPHLRNNFDVNKTPSQNNPRV